MNNAIDISIAIRALRMHTVKPIDAEAVRAAASETSAILTVEEHWIDGGLESRVANSLVAARMSVPMRKIGVAADSVPGTGPAEFLRAFDGFDQSGCQGITGGEAFRSCATE